MPNALFGSGFCVVLVCYGVEAQRAKVGRCLIWQRADHGSCRGFGKEDCCFYSGERYSGQASMIKWSSQQ